jgi:2-keto-4-pentenoate hydratase/2-oxohepta-3-ene-1,7-dioic acid hydratase in catechol pathway
MTISILRTADAWWVQTPTGAARIATDAGTTRELLADRAAIEAAAALEGSTPVEELALLSPVTAPCRVVAQMTNFRSHIKDAGMRPETTPLTFFRKASGSISGPSDDVVRPSHVRFLDYEVEIGLVLGKELPVGTALSAPSKPIELLGSLLPPAVKWKAFFKRQAGNQKYLQHGDVVEATVATDDGVIDLGAQRMKVVYA